MNKNLIDNIIELTWGQAIEFRIEKQKPSYRKNNQSGSWATEGKK